MVIAGTHHLTSADSTSGDSAVQTPGQWSRPAGGVEPGSAAEFAGCNHHRRVQKTAPRQVIAEVPKRRSRVGSRWPE